MSHTRAVSAKRLLLTVGVGCTLFLTPAAALAAAPPLPGAVAGAAHTPDVLNRPVFPGAADGIPTTQADPAGVAAKSPGSGSNLRTVAIISLVALVAGWLFQRRRKKTAVHPASSGRRQTAAGSQQRGPLDGPCSVTTATSLDHSPAAAPAGYEADSSTGPGVVDVAVRDNAGLVLLVEDETGWALPSGPDMGSPTLLDEASRIIADLTGWAVPPGEQLDASILSEDADRPLVEVRLAVAAPVVPGGAWGTVEQAAQVLDDDTRLGLLSR